MKRPESITIDDDLLCWSKTPCADGYNIHNGEKYIDTVYGTKYPLTQSGSYSVSAFIKTDNGDEAHTTRTNEMLYPCVVKAGTPQFIKDEYNLIFSDEFTGDSLDLTKWDTEQPWGDQTITNNEEQYYVDVANDTVNPSPFSVEDSVLTITASPVTPSADTQNQSYLSGCIKTFDTFRYKYGFQEWCFRAPCDADGYWAAFWAFASNFTSQEIDVSEIVGNPAYGDLKCNWQAYHHGIPNLSSLDANQYNGGTIASCNGDVYDSNNGWNLPKINCGEWNHAAVLWEEDRLVWYVNGLEVNSICDPDKISAEEKYIIANLAVGGILGGTVDRNAFPATLEIDYIRVWQK